MVSRNGEAARDGAKPAGNGEARRSRTAGRRLRLGKRVTGMLAVFTALAALTGSQTGLGFSPVAAAGAAQGLPGTATGPDGTTAPPFGDATTGVPGIPGTPGVLGTAPVDGGGTLPLLQPPLAPLTSPFTDPQRNGPALPQTVFAAYRKAEAALAVRSPGCHLPWQLLAAIGEVESGQAGRGAVDAAGTTFRPILGPVLNGAGFAAIADTDGGRYDGDAAWDRAVGPMQFIPSTWASWGVDANGDGKADPNNIFDAAEAAGRYLCAGGRDLSDQAQLDRAVLGYNHSSEYLRTVRNWMAHFGSGSPVTTPDRPGTPSPLAPLLPAAPPSPLAPVTPAPPVTPGQGAGAQPAPGATTGPATTPSGTPSAEPTGTPTGAPSPSATPSGSPSPSPSSSASPSPSATPSGTPGTTPSGSASPEPTATETATPTPTATTTPSGTPSTTPGTPSATPTATPTDTPTDCATPTGTPTGTPSAGPSASASPSATPSATATATGPGCPTPTATATTGAPSAAPSAAATPSASLSPSAAAPSAH
ncbi:lytic transglycosylase domain-containing protein [Kitasatospora sp. NPDC059463]|uniref:lytic transglycosylase domain-containing protein n=1 Tax=unclassified Kitasatospora TaxID=2633591 RepID=UPI003685B966